VSAADKPIVAIPSAHAVALLHYTTKYSIIFARCRQLLHSYPSPNEFALQTASRFCRFCSAESSLMPRMDRSFAFARWRQCDPIYYVVPLMHAGQHSKQHFDQFSDFCRAYQCVQHTDTQTDRQTDRQNTLLHLGM